MLVRVRRVVVQWRCPWKEWRQTARMNGMCHGCCQKCHLGKGSIAGGGKITRYRRKENDHKRVFLCRRLSGIDTEHCHAHLEYCLARFQALRGGYHGSLPRIPDSLIDFFCPNGINVTEQVNDYCPDCVETVSARWKRSPCQ
jgi:hypothetical protein